MLRIRRYTIAPVQIRRPVTLAGVLVLALAAAGCSADVARFDSPYFGLNDSAGATGSVPPNSGLRSSSLSDQSPDSGGSYTPPSPAPSYAPRGPQMAALPEPSLPPPSAGPLNRQSKPSPSYVGVPSAAPAAERPRPQIKQAAIEAGEAIEVQSGDTLFGLARKHHVSVSELSKLNKLQNPRIFPGQKLVLPTGSSAASGATHESANRLQAASRPAPSSVTSASVPSADGTHVVQSGESLYSISRKYKVSLAELQRENGITDPRRVKPGVTLRLPGAASPEQKVASALPPAAVRDAQRGAQVAGSVATAPAEAADVSRPVASSTQPTIINADASTRVASAQQTANMTDATATQPVVRPPSKGTEVASAAGAATQGAAGLKFRWPAKGKVISKFGRRADGSHNDGIDISVPLGTDVLSAEGGVVAYAGNELKGFGNLVLVRHDNGWVTAYAHNEELLVRRGDKVRRGQALAKAGKTGGVDQPTVHFEIRHGSKPVDPSPYLE